MILALIILAPLVILALWQFIKLFPVGVEKRKVRIYNSVVILIGVLLCGLLTLNVYENMASGSDRAWWTMSPVGVFAQFIFSLREPKTLHHAIVAIFKWPSIVASKMPCSQ